MMDRDLKSAWVAMRWDEGNPFRSFYLGAGELEAFCMLEKAVLDELDVSSDRLFVLGPIDNAGGYMLEFPVRVMLAGHGSNQRPVGCVLQPFMRTSKYAMWRAKMGHIPRSRLDAAIEEYRARQTGGQKA